MRNPPNETYSSTLNSMATLRDSELPWHGNRPTSSRRRFGSNAETILTWPTHQELKEAFPDNDFENLSEMRAA